MKTFYLKSVQPFVGDGTGYILKYSDNDIVNNTGSETEVIITKIQLIRNLQEEQGVIPIKIEFPNI